MKNKIWNFMKAHRVALLIVASITLLGVSVAGSGYIEVVDLNDNFNVSCATTGDSGLIAVVSEGTVVAAGTPAFKVGANYRLRGRDDVTLSLVGSSAPGVDYTTSPEPFSVAAIGGAAGVRADAGFVFMTDAGCFYTPADDAGGITCQADVGYPRAGPMVRCTAINGATTLNAARTVPGSGR